MSIDSVGKGIQSFIPRLGLMWVLHVISSLLFLLAFVQNQVKAETDLVALLYGNAAITEPIMPMSLNAALQDLIGSVKNFTRFPYNLQRAMLWSAGWVQAIPDTNVSTLDDSLVNYVQVYVLCGHTMSDIFQSAEDFSNATACELQRCKSNIVTYTRSTCLTSYIETMTRCALSPETANLSFRTLQQSSGPMWSSPGDLEEKYNPQIFQYKDAREDLTNLYLLAPKDSWRMTDDMCPNHAQFIAPCREISASVVAANVQERIWCEPKIELGVRLWVEEVYRAMASEEDNVWHSPSSSIMSIVVVVLSVLLGLFLLGSAALFVIWRRSKNCMKDGLHENENNTFFVQAYSFTGEDGTMNDSTVSGQYVANEKFFSSLGSAMEIETVNERLRMRSPDLAAFCDDQELMLKRITFEGIVYRQVMTSGPNREVWSGEYEGQQVAITFSVVSFGGCIETASGSRNSSMLSNNDLNALVDFTKEIRIAASLDHPNIARFVGLAWRTLPELCMVSEFVALGNLAHFLAQADSKNLTWKNEKLAIAADISNALVYLHSLSPIVLHCDLKSLNILLTEDLHAKVSDFGLSRKMSFDETMTSSVGTLLWTAPEVLRGERYSEKADIYSFGVVLAELDTCLPPYAYSHGRKNNVQKDMNWVPQIASGHASPSFRPDCPKELRELAAQCLDQDPNNRPPAMQIVYLLRSKIPLTL